MKKLLSVICLFTLLSSSAVLAHPGAAGNVSNKNRSYWNPITIHNYAPYSIRYAFNNDNFYNLDRSETDVYHSGIGDKRAFFVVAGCTEVNANGECMTYTSHALPDYFNAEEIGSINIRSVTDVEVICLDGTTTSCVIK